MEIMLVATQQIDQEIMWLLFFQEKDPGPYKECYI